MDSALVPSTNTLPSEGNCTWISHLALCLLMRASDESKCSLIRLAGELSRYWVQSPLMNHTIAIHFLAGWRVMGNYSLVSISIHVSPEVLIGNLSHDLSLGKIWKWAGVSHVLGVWFMWEQSCQYTKCVCLVVVQNQCNCCLHPVLDELVRIL